MLKVLASTWALLLGMFLLMIGNGFQGTVLGLRGAAEGFSTDAIAFVMSAYFAGFLLASRVAPVLIQRVGHVRVFSALGSMVSAVLVLYPVAAEPWAWALLRALVGFCYCGIYITAESWLNGAASNRDRGRALSLYMIVQMGGIVVAQGLVAASDVTGFVIFIIPSVLVSLAFAPVLLSVSQVAPAFAATRRVSFARLFKASPLACIGMPLLGVVFAAQFGMSAVYGTRAGLSEGQITLMVALTYVAALVLQYPIGYLSDRVDRRTIVLALAAFGAAAALLGALLPGAPWLALLVAAVLGGTSNPLYALLIAHANDYLEAEEMAGASAGLLLVNGLGAIAGPLLVGRAMGAMGAGGFWMVIALAMGGLAVSAAWRMRSAPDRPIVGSRGVFAPLPATASPVAVASAPQERTDP